MTQPEQEAREMLIAIVDPHDRFGAEVLRGGQDVSIRASHAVRAMLAFAARPTAGIDEVMSVTLSRDGVVTSHNAYDADFDEMVAATETIIKELQVRLSDRKYCPYSHGSAAKSAPTPAKTGERGAVIEECLSAVRAVVQQQDADHGAANSGGAEAALEAIRALSQPLPGAPIVGEGPKL